MDGVVVSLVHSSQTGTVALQLEDGRIRKLIWGQQTYLYSCVLATDPWGGGGVNFPFFIFLTC